MAGGGKVDILILRDNAAVRRFRMAVGWLRALWLVPLFLLLLLGAALAVAYHLRQDNLALARREAAMRGEMDTVGKRLVHLETIEKILGAKDLTALETLIASYNAEDPGWWKPGGEARREGEGGGKDREAASPDLGRLLASIDANQAGVDNLRTKFESKRLQLNFDLSNVTPQTNLVGRVEVALIGNDASLTPLKGEKDELAFQIQRFKQIAATLPLPPRIDVRDLYALRLRILDPSGKCVFSRIYPLSRD